MELEQVFELRPDLWHCADCSTAYAPGLPACPQCGSVNRVDVSELRQANPAIGRTVDEAAVKAALADTKGDDSGV